MTAFTPAGIAGAYLAGLASFLSPCVFPLVPGYLSYLAGTAGEQAQYYGEHVAQMRWRVALHAVFFVCGFSLIFIALGATASTLGGFLRTNLALLRQISGIVLILAGLQVAGILSIMPLLRERRFEVARGDPTLLKSGLIGLAFGAGWTPCIGPILGSIYTLAAVSASLRSGVLLLAIYSFGLGLPFLVTGLLIDRITPLFRRMSRLLPVISLISGSLLVLMGVLVLSGALTRLAQFSPLIGG
ncbi:MAG TPA: cytochrome c biogenesis CcdA family protein [Chloroflexota bacterium]|nr:cytochrome c biogenesis CcdA family protein [Chloroflexota bacterium]